MPTMTDNIVAGPAGHVFVQGAGSFCAGGSGHTTTGAPGEVDILPATQGFDLDSATTDFEAIDATQSFINVDATQAIFPESISGTIFHLVG